MSGGSNRLPATANGKDARGRFVKGHAGLGGRPIGSLNKLQSSFIDALTEDFAKHGQKAIAAARRDNPAAYLRLIGSLVPREALLQIGRRDYSDVREIPTIELHRLIRECAEIDDGDGGEVLDLEADD